MNNHPSLTAQEITDIMAFIRAGDHDHGHDHHHRDGVPATATPPQEHYGQHTFIPLTLVSRVERAPRLVRLWFALPENEDLAAWSDVNVALRLEIPVRPKEFEGIEAAPPTASRAYTIAEVDTEHRRVAIDFVRHGDSSPVMQWLAGITAGEVIYCWEPHQHRVPGQCARLLLVADSTALPAALSILRDGTMFKQATLVTSADPAELDHGYDFLSNVPVHHVSDEPGALSDFITTGIWDCDWVWACGESTEMREIRRHARHTLGLDRISAQVFGYWKRELSSTTIDLSRLVRVREAMMRGEDIEKLEFEFEEEL